MSDDDDKAESSKGGESGECVESRRGPVDRKMAEEKEPTLEELMAELDAGLTVDLNDASADGGKSTADSGLAADTSDFEAELGLIAKPLTEDKADATAVKNSTPPSASSAPVSSSIPAPRSASSPPTTEPGQAAEGKKAQPAARNDSAASAVSSWWKSVKASAEGLIAADGIAIDTSALGDEYQRGKEVSREVASKLSTFFAMASQEVMSTAADVAASARTMNSKILLKPQASFGVPLELIVKRECGNEEAAQVPLVLEGVLNIMEQYVNKNGGAALPVTLLSDTPDETAFAKLEDLRDELDTGETLESLELSTEPIEVIAGLLKLFFQELPGPLLTHTCYEDFMNALLYEGGVSSASDVADLLPCVNKAVARRVLRFIHTNFIKACEAPEAARAAEDRVALCIGPWLLRSGAQEKSMLMLHALQVSSNPSRVRSSTQWRSDLVHSVSLPPPCPISFHVCCASGQGGD
jgi:hypothetical protein